MTDDELIAVLNEHADRLVATLDVEDAPFHALGIIALSSARSDGVERKIVLWLDPEPLNDEWQPEGGERSEGDSK